MKLYLYQISKWIEKTIGVRQQIIHTKGNNKIRYTDYDSPDELMHMTLLVDADIDVKSIAWSGEYGLGLNVDCESNDNGEKCHVILWTDSELGLDKHGYFMCVTGASSGILVINNPDIQITNEAIAEMLAFPKSRWDKFVRPFNIFTKKEHNIL